WLISINLPMSSRAQPFAPRVPGRSGRDARSSCSPSSCSGVKGARPVLSHGLSGSFRLAAISRWTIRLDVLSAPRRTCTGGRQVLGRYWAIGLLPYRFVIVSTRILKRRHQGVRLVFVSFRFFRAVVTIGPCFPHGVVIATGIVPAGISFGIEIAPVIF